MGSGHGERLSRKQEQAIAALLAEPSIRAAAGEAGVSEKCLRLWLKLPTFQAAYRQARQELLQRAVGRLLRSTDNAVSALNRAMACGQTPMELKAAAAVLTHAFRG